jgi:peptidoglycan/LPS O-acetylase OafA/YrhL
MIRKHNYVPAFDGLRGVLASAVIFVHVFVRTVPPDSWWCMVPWAAVDCFFVLSGFLITLLLMDEWDRDRNLNLARFYTRRLFRLGPAYVTAVSLTILGLYFNHKPLYPVLPILPFYATYTMNLAVAAGLYNPLPVNQVWSLCVEWQFYLGWAWILRKLGPRKALGFSVGAVVGIAIYRSGLYTFLNWGHFWIASKNAGQRIYSCTDTRIDSIFVGCCLALLMRVESLQPFWERLKQWRPLTSVSVTCVLVCVALTGLYGPTAEESWRSATFGYTLVSTSMALFIAGLFLHPEAWPARALSYKPLVFVGQVSFGIYLFHMGIRGIVFRPLHMMDGIIEPLWKPIVAFLFVWCGSVGAAALHFYLVETRFLAMRERLRFSERATGPATVPREAAAAASGAEPRRAVAAS